MLANYLFAVLMPVCVCVSVVVTCECVDLDSSACAAGFHALQMPCTFVKVLLINESMFIESYQSLHALLLEVTLASNSDLCSFKDFTNQKCLSSIIIVIHCGALVKLCCSVLSDTN